ncbi:hypothetical protein EIN_247000 [Entamoeba invadens IP1]|uniref:Uncharacterized protein n=1 Tax=Entamoeba invadens IP1 TaxID=370355 RepID=A0A0A1UDX5_ENTIV|nr:hypothetical protein EIN_247000 [Entamoeba invadens IP1]ELP94806.1 hypothetical protein EIN_247000 [Entamoeba invadens IP1]|eukprot:XP_004261577.1 hypothetical protein EIN_247000 [Entamoeba invadens IP1]
MFGSKTPKQRTIRISVVRSHAGGKEFWKRLGKDWKKFGAVEIKVSVKLMKKALTYKALLKERPDIIICSDTAGSPSSFTAEEVKNLEKYVVNNTSKHLIGTYALFQHLEHRTSEYDNRMMCPFFGIDEKMKFTTLNIDPSVVFTPTSVESVLWKNMDTPYRSDGYSHTQLPVSMNWFDKENHLCCGKGATILARNDDGTAVVLYNSTKTYSTLYISSMPEFNTMETNTDLQFFYNAFIFLTATDSLLSLQGLCMKCIGKMNKKIERSMIPPQLLSTLENASRRYHHHVLKDKKYFRKHIV